MAGDGRILWGRAMARTAAVAVLLMFLFVVVSIDGDREQEAFNGGAVGMIAAAAAIYGVGSLWILRRGKGSRGGRWFVVYGGMVLMGVAVVGYFVWASIRMHRVL